LNVSNAVVGYLNRIKDGILAHFDVLDTFIYDESLDFRGRASQYLARESVFQKLEGETPKDWVFIIWNRGSISESGLNNRVQEIQYESPDAGYPGHADSTVLYRLASIDIELKIVTNNISIAEYIEEYLYVLVGELATFDADYGEYGIWKCAATPAKTTSFEKEDINELGPVIGVGLSTALEFPVLLPAKKGNLILEINEKLWFPEIENIRNAQLVRENTIEP
jgi:hypothetical protein